MGKVHNKMGSGHSDFFPVSLIAFFYLQKTIMENAELQGIEKSLRNVYIFHLDYALKRDTRNHLNKDL